MDTIRLIIDKPASAAMNMAIDETLFERAIEGHLEPILRFYEWSEPSYTLGYFQDPERVRKKLPFWERSRPMVKRITGGGLVRHSDDLTFSLIMPETNPWIPKEVKSSYLKINEVLRECFRGDTPLKNVEYADCKAVPNPRGQKDGDQRACFKNPSCYDLLIDTKKIAGASQRRKKGVLLHQSTLFTPLAKSALRPMIINKFEKLWKIQLEEKPLTEEERAQAEMKLVALTDPVRNRSISNALGTR